jgi:hypothetical protein
MKEANNIRRQFTVYPYYGVTNVEYFFTVDTANNSLQRIENDLSGVHWVIARDMGKQVVITDIDANIKTYWQNANGWTNLTVVKPGIARKFQVLNMPKGSFESSGLPNADNYAAANAAAYTSPNDTVTPVYNVTNNPVNDLLQVGFARTTVSNSTFQNLPFGTFFAVTDPVIITYSSGGSTYTRAIKNRIDETTLF